MDLLDTAGSRALQTDHCRLTREDGFILEFGKGDFLRVVDKTFNLKKVFAGVDLRYTTVVPDEKIRVFSDFSL